jgi:hypothetical protein
MESFSFLKESPKIACFRMMKDNKTREEIMSSLNLPMATYYRYRQAVLGEEKKA